MQILCCLQSSVLLCGEIGLQSNHQLCMSKATLAKVLSSARETTTVTVVSGDEAAQTRPSGLSYSCLL